MGRLTIHIGAHKTGSTSVQDYFHAHREILAADGFIYPETGLLGTAHHRIAWACGVGRRQPDAGYLREVFTALGRDLVNADVLLSSEEFERAGVENLRPWLADHDARIVFYTRRQDLMMESIYHQHVAAYDLRFDGSIKDLINRHDFAHNLDFHATAERWRKGLEHAVVVVRPIGTSLVAEDVCEDLLTLIGSDRLLAACREAPLERRNRSLSASSLCLLAHLNRFSMTREQHHRILMFLQERDEGQADARLLDSGSASMFYAQFRESNLRLFRDYLGMDACLFDEARVPGANHVVNFADVSTEEVREIAARFGLRP